MTATGHALVGAAIITKVPNPWIAFPLILASHFILDKVPHWDPMTNRKTKTKSRILTETVIDVLLGLGLSYLLFVVWAQQNPILIFSAALTSYSPDLFEAPYVMFGWNFKPAYYAYRFQRWIHDVGFNSRAQAPWGIVTQILVVLVFLLWAATK